MKYFQLAMGFLTVLPIGYKGEYRAGDLGRAAGWYPLAGLVIGLLIVGAHWLLAPILPVALLPVILVAVWVILTGGLHLDGLADCGDGLLAAVSPERRLEIMKDPRLGTFGGVTLALHLLMKVSLVGVLVTAPWEKMVLAFVIAPVMARWLILIAGRQRMARPGGLGAEFSQGVNWRTFFYAAVVPLPLVVLGGIRGILAAALAHLVLLIILRAARNRLGGVTGDVLGLTVELGESAVLLAFALILPYGL